MSTTATWIPPHLPSLLPGGVALPGEAHAPRIRLSEHPDCYQVHVALPHGDPRDLEVSADGDTLTLRGVVERAVTGETVRSHARVEFARTFEFSDRCASSDLTREIDGHTLCLTVPRQTTSTPRRERATLHGPGERRWTLTPNDTLSLGRDDDNDIPLHHRAISRRHALITWNPGAPLPVLCDLDSCNGTRLDEELLHDARAPVSEGSTLHLGPFTFRLEFDDASAPAVVPSPSDELTFLARADDERSGLIQTTADLHQVLRSLEAHQRTGTLELRLASNDGLLVFGLGRLVDATWCGLQGTAAFEAILGTPDCRGGWRFTRAVEPCEGSIHRWPSDWLRSSPKGHARAGN